MRRGEREGERRGLPVNQPANIDEEVIGCSNVGLTVTDSYLWVDNWYNKLWVKLEVARGSLVVIPFGGRRLFIAADRDYIIGVGGLVSLLLIAALLGMQMNRVAREIVFRTKEISIRSAN